MSCSGREKRMTYHIKEGVSTITYIDIDCDIEHRNKYNSEKKGGENRAVFAFLFIRQQLLFLGPNTVRHLHYI